MRKTDTMWRDASLWDWHKAAHVPYPVAGMTFPTIEYDNGVPVGLVSYMSREAELPTGPDVGKTYRAFGNLGSETGPLPFFTVRYDNRKWAYQVFPHNDQARAYTDGRLDPLGWCGMTEAEYATLLYGLRNRQLPAARLAAAGVHLALNPWHGGFVRRQEDEQWPGASMSSRRRGFEPLEQMAHRHLIPVTDIDLAVVNVHGAVRLLVDYKLGDVWADLKGPSLRALAGLRHHARSGVPAMVVRYTDRGHSEDGPVWMFSVACLNQAARLLLSFVLGSTGHDTEEHARLIAGEDGVWTGLSESQWLDVLTEARLG